MTERKPMEYPFAAREYFKPVPKEHRVAPAMNRIWTKLDHEYRIQLRTNLLCDTIIVKARVREI